MGNNAMSLILDRLNSAIPKSETAGKNKYSKPHIGAKQIAKELKKQKNSLTSERSNNAGLITSNEGKQSAVT